MTNLEERQRAILLEAKLQLEYLHEKFGKTGTTEAVIAKIDAITEEKWGCYCDLEDGEEPDGCVMDEGDYGGCVYAQRLLRAGKVRDDCQEWRRYQ